MRLWASALEREESTAVAPLPARSSMHEAYEAESLEHIGRSVRFLCKLGIVLVIAFAPFDCARHPDAVAVSLAVRLINVGILALVLAFLHHPAGRDYPRAAGFICCLSTAAMIFSMLFAAGGYASQYVIGLGMVLLTAPLAIPWRPAWSFALCSVVVTIFVVGNVASQPLRHDPRFFDNLFALLATSAIVVLATRMAETLRWREFHTRWTLAQAYRHKSEFFANMSHELRTPIHVIVGYVDMLRENAAPGGRNDTHEMLDRVRAEGMLLYRLVSDLLDYAKVEAGKMEVNAEAVVVADVLSDLGAAFRPLAEKNGLDLQIACEPDLAPIVSDRHKLEQILRNLLSNAIKFTPSGSVRVRAARADELLRAGDSELVVFDGDGRKPNPMRAQVAIAVEDTGIGIQRGDIDKLAIDFQQVAREAATQRGTGLGLSLSRKLVALLGGRLAVRSTYGRGTSFILLLPAEERVTERPQLAVPVSPPYRGGGQGEVALETSRFGSSPTSPQPPPW